MVTLAARAWRGVVPLVFLMLVGSPARAQLPAVNVSPTGTLEVDCELPVGRVISLEGRVVTTCPGRVAVVLPAGERIPVVVALGRSVARRSEVVLPVGGRLRVVVTNVGGEPSMQTVTPAADAPAFDVVDAESLTQDAQMLPAAPGLPSREEQKKADDGPRKWLASTVGLVGVGLMVTGLALILGGVTQTVVGASPPPAATGTLPPVLGPAAEAAVFTGPTLVVMGVGFGTLGVVVLVVGLLLGARPF
jgi:hypothetical protein